MRGGPINSRRGGGYAGGGCCVNVTGVIGRLRMDG